MEGLIDLEIASEVERKVYLAFLKGLTQIKFQSQFKKEESIRQKNQQSADESQQHQTEESEVDLEYLYTNLFANTGIQGD